MILIIFYLLSVSAWAQSDLDLDWNDDGDDFIEAAPAKPARGGRISTTRRSEWKWGLGLGYLARVNREVNPDYTEMKGFGQLYAQIRRKRWAMALEVDREERVSSSGALNIQTDSVGLGSWWRYHFRDPERWTLFVSGGAGVYLDEVTSTYLNAHDERTGRRFFTGLGGGLTRTLWNVLMIEGEGRVSVVQDRRDPVGSVIFRLGVQL